MTIYLVLDTNALPYKKGNIASGFWGSVLALCAIKDIKPAISEVVLDESVNIMRDSAEPLIEQFVSAHSGLSRFVDLEPIYAPDAEAVASNYEAMLKERFEVLALDGDHAREALRREARRVPPAKGGSGGRDTAIWLTVVGLLQAGHEVHFVTNNSEDFGKGALLPDLLTEIAGLEHRIHYHPDANAFLDSIAARIAVPTVSDEDVKTSFDDSLREVVMRHLPDQDIDHWWSALTEDYDLSDIRSEHAYEVEHRGLARVTATFKFPSFAGKFSGWLEFDPASGVPAPSEVDSPPVIVFD